MTTGKRVFDLLLAAVLLLLLSPLLLVLAAVVRLTSTGPAVYWSERVGRGNRIFRMPKFRSMRVDAPQVATHLLPDPASLLTPVGGLLRRSSMDELPQLWSILKGDLSFVGPRPALFNQDDLIALRIAYGVDKLVPGLTGLAQISGRDELSIPAKVELDREYVRRRSVRFDLYILLRTFGKAVRAEGIRH